MLEFYARSVDVIVTLEDHVLKGGFGSAVLEELNILGLHTPVVRIGWPDQFIEHGKPEALRAKYGVSVDAILDRVRPTLRKIDEQIDEHKVDDETSANGSKPANGRKPAPIRSI
jgi:deoxyxylulose-5-phosphate synthase